MLNWLYSLPSLVLALIFIVITLISMKLVHNVVHFLIRDKIPSEGHLVAVHVHEGVVLLVSLVLTFSLIQALDNLKIVENSLSAEASQINNLDRILFNYKDPRAVEIRADLLTYTNSIIEDEWPSLKEGFGSKKTEALFFKLSDEVAQLTPKNFQEQSLYSSAIAQVNLISDSRDLRLQGLRLHLPAIYWIVILVTILTKLGISGLMDRGKISGLILSIQMVAIAALMALVFMFDRPYLGETAVQPEAIENVIKTMNTRLSMHQ